MEKNTQTNFLEYEKMNIPKITEKGYQDVVDSIMWEIEKSMDNSYIFLCRDFLKYWTISPESLDITKFENYQTYLDFISKLPEGDGMYATYECSWFNKWTNQWAGWCSYTIPKEWMFIDSSNGVLYWKRTYSAAYKVPNGTYKLHEQWNTPTSCYSSENYEKYHTVKFHNGYELEIKDEEEFEIYKKIASFYKEAHNLCREKLSEYKKDLEEYSYIPQSIRIFKHGIFDNCWAYKEAADYIENNKVILKKDPKIATLFSKNTYYNSFWPYNIPHREDQGSNLDLAKQLSPIEEYLPIHTSPQIDSLKIKLGDDKDKELYVGKKNILGILVDNNRYNDMAKVDELRWSDTSKITIYWKNEHKLFPGRKIKSELRTINDHCSKTTKQFFNDIDHKMAFDNKISDDNEPINIFDLNFIKNHKWNKDFLECLSNPENYERNYERIERYKIQNKLYLTHWWEKTKIWISNFFKHKWVDTVTLNSETLWEFEKFMNIYWLLWENTMKMIDRLWYEIISNLSERLLSKISGYTEKHIPSFSFQLDNKKFLWKTSRWGYQNTKNDIETWEKEWIIFIDHEGKVGKNNQLMIIRNQLDPTHSTIITRSLIRSIKTENVLDIVENLNNEIQEWVNLQNELNCWYRPEEDEIN
jgi:hypothetical protein